MADDRAGGGLALRRNLMSAVVILALVTVLAGVLLAGQIKSPAQLAAETAPPPSTVLTAPVRSQRVSQTVVARGEVRPARTTEVAPQPPSGDVRPVVTRVGVTAGTTVRAGRVLAEVAGRPVFVLEGSIPSYRDLAPGDTGDDVAQLQRSLETLGHATYGDPSGTYGPATSAAVEALYAAMGYDAERVGDGEVHAAQVAVDRAVAAVGVAERTAAREPGPAPAELVAARAAVVEAQERYADAARRAGALVPMSEAVFVRALPAVAVKVSARVGQDLGTSVVSLALGGMVVEAFINPSDRSLVRPGMSAIVSTAGESGLRAKVTAVSRLPVEREGALATRLLLALTDQASRRVAGQSLQVVIASSATKGKVLVVPLSAVYSSTDGSTRIRKVSGDGPPEEIAVRTGPQGDGYVEIEPVDGLLAPGDLVQVGA